VKWGAFLKRASEIGADFLATGHYARVEQLQNGRYSVKKSVTAKKDQTYVLYNLTQEELAHTLMPVGEYTKPQIREIAEKLNLPVAHKKDSQDICFVEDGDYARFIKEETGTLGKKGVFKLVDGEVVGKHTGTVQYTIGQRKGLGIALGHPVYVTGIDAETGDVILGSNDDLFSDVVYATDINHMGEERFDENKTYTAKVRYSQTSVPCHVKYVDDNTIRIEFESKVRAATPGQAAVIYDGEFIAGGGMIIRK
jgi:tRNA-specific 2-thiouridylase